MNTKWVKYSAEHWVSKSEALAGGAYQSDLLSGHEAWSGSTLKGKAKKYGGRYAASRESLLKRMKQAGIPYHFQTIERRKVLMVGFEA